MTEGDVFSEWQAAGGNTSGFEPEIAAFLETQNLALTAQLGGFHFGHDAYKALVNAVNAALGGS